MVNVPPAETDPVEHGGRRSRGGYRYQDLCALRFGIAAASDGTWHEIRCESHDDVVLIRRTGESVTHRRFVQVKFQANAGSHWSIPRLCRGDAAGASVDHSIVCKLFDNHSPSGDVDFRLAVNEGVVDLLRPFQYVWGSPEPVIDLTCPAARDFLRRLEGWTPASGHPVEYYIARFAIERHSADVDDLEARIRDELTRLLSSETIRLLSDELWFVFNHLYLLFYRAASDEWRRSGSTERISPDLVRSEAVGHARRVMGGTDELASAPQPEKLRTTLQGFDLPEVVIAEALTQRNKYVAAERRARGSLLVRAIESAFDEVRAICMEESIKSLEERAAFDGVTLSSVVSRVATAHASGAYASQGVSLSVMQGMLFFLIGRGHLSRSR